jgi:hypothetical protein
MAQEQKLLFLIHRRLCSLEERFFNVPNRLAMPVSASMETKQAIQNLMDRYFLYNPAAWPVALIYNAFLDPSKTLKKTLPRLKTSSEIPELDVFDAFLRELTHIILPHETVKHVERANYDFGEGNVSIGPSETDPNSYQLLIAKKAVSAVAPTHRPTDPLEIYLLFCPYGENLLAMAQRSIRHEYAPQITPVQMAYSIAWSVEHRLSVHIRLNFAKKGYSVKSPPRDVQDHYKQMIQIITGQKPHQDVVYGQTQEDIFNFPMDSLNNWYAVLNFGWDGFHLYHEYKNSKIPRPRWFEKKNYWLDSEFDKRAKVPPDGVFNDEDPFYPNPLRIREGEPPRYGVWSEDKKNFPGRLVF